LARRPQLEWSRGQCSFLPAFAAPVTPPALDDIQDVKVTKDMLGLAKHIVSQKAGHFEPDKIEDQYETMVPLS
jgi:hypothetical protein